MNLETILELISGLSLPALALVCSGAFVFGVVKVVSAVMDYFTKEGDRRETQATREAAQAERNAAQDERQQQVWKLITDTQKRLREDIEQYSEKRVKEAEAQRLVLLARIEEAEAKMTALNEQLAQRDVLVEEIRQALRALETKHANLQKKYDALLKERDEWKSKWETSEAAIEVLQTGVQAIQKGDTDQLKPPPCDDEDAKAAADAAEEKKIA
jgi:chromosome segregation ATPase